MVIFAGLERSPSLIAPSKQKTEKIEVFLVETGTIWILARYCGIRAMTASTQHARPQPIVRTYSRSPPGE